MTPWMAEARKLREEAGIRQVTVARALRISKTDLCAWEAGRRPVPRRHAPRLRRVMEGLARHAEIRGWAG